MNEPSAFEGPEATVPKDTIHYGGIEHRNIHNMYGFLQTKATYDGLLRRGNSEHRPFILTRSFYSGMGIFVGCDSNVFIGFSFWYFVLWWRYWRILWQS
jgi:alpha-glucosidase (family GH31 glycosyl hydrolase)